MLLGNSSRRVNSGVRCLSVEGLGNTYEERLLTILLFMSDGRSTGCELVRSTETP